MRIKNPVKPSITQNKVMRIKNPVKPSITQNIEIPLEQIQAWQVEILDLLAEKKLSDRQIITWMGTLNALVWRVAEDYGVLYHATKEEKESGLLPKSRVIVENLHRLMTGECAAQYAIISLCDYLKHCWPRAFNSDDKMRRVRDIFLEHGLFYYDKENRPKGANWGAMHGVKGQGTATPPVLEKMNVPKMVIWYNVLHSQLKVKLGEEEMFAFMPDHGGMLMIDLFDTMFYGCLTFSGNVITENPKMMAPLPEEPENFVKKPIVWLWRNLLKLPKEVWRSLVRRDKQIPEPVKYQSVPWDGVEVIDRADFYIEKELAIA